jgi:hypothetical protein
VFVTDNASQSGQTFAGKAKGSTYGATLWEGSSPCVQTTNSRLGWKIRKTLAFCRSDSDEEKRFITLTPGANLIKLFWCKSTQSFCKLDHFIKQAIYAALL